MKNKIKERIKRYWIAEISWTLWALALPTIASFFTSNIVILALSGTRGENIWFYWTMIFQEIYKLKRLKHSPKNIFIKSLRNILLEFGVAEISDSLFVRPAIMYLTLSNINNMQLGIFIWKIIGDLVFYIPTIISYELRKKYIKD